MHTMLSVIKTAIKNERQTDDVSPDDVSNDRLARAALAALVDSGHTVQICGHGHLVPMDATNCTSCARNGYRGEVVHLAYLFVNFMEV